MKHQNPLSKKLSSRCFAIDKKYERTVLTHTYEILTHLLDILTLK